MGRFRAVTPRASEARQSRAHRNIRETVDPKRWFDEAKKLEQRRNEPIDLARKELRMEPKPR
jgi:hypothetical protein